MARCPGTHPPKAGCQPRVVAATCCTRVQASTCMLTDGVVLVHPCCPELAQLWHASWSLTCGARMSWRRPLYSFFFWDIFRRCDRFLHQCEYERRRGRLRRGLGRRRNRGSRTPRALRLQLGARQVSREVLARAAVLRRACLQGLPRPQEKYAEKSSRTEQKCAGMFS